jgi:hypothetical protein
MATDPTKTAVSPSQPLPVSTIPKEIRLISHSSLFYWWPVWFFGLIFSVWTMWGGHRMAIVPSNSIIEMKDGGASAEIHIPKLDKDDRLLKDATKLTDTTFQPKLLVAATSSIGPLYFVILILVIIITNVPLRGLWSLITIFGVVVLALIFTVFNWWDELLKNFGDLHIFMNMAGYLFLSIVLLIAWCVSVFVFDRRSYMIFTPGQVKVCEEIGGREKVYDTMGLTLEKHRDDWFRHIILGFGTGDLTVKTAGADRHEINMPNIFLIGYKIPQIEQMIRTKTVN